jgi:hypothetical protein
MRRERELEDLIECRTLNEAGPGQPATRVSARSPAGTPAGGTALAAVNAGQAGLPGGLLSTARPPAYHVRWLVVSELARRHGPAAPL